VNSSYWSGVGGIFEASGIAMAATPAPLPGDEQRLIAAA
jgi:hypothetical protein